jgi:formate-nitrite transporter family protein
VAVAPTPAEIYRRAQEEGERRLSATPLELAATGFVAGFTIVFGIAAMGIVHALVLPRGGEELADLAAALGFGIGFVFLVVGRSELFSENFFDPVAAAIDHPGRGVWWRLGRLWIVVLALNLVGGALLTLILTLEGALPEGAPESLSTFAEEIVARDALASLARALAAGALLTLMSYLLQAVDGAGARIAIAYLVGFFLAVGPFDHVVVTALHLVFGLRHDADLGAATLSAAVGLAALGNLVGGLVFVTLTHLAQAKASRAGRADV